MSYLSSNAIALDSADRFRPLPKRSAPFFAVSSPSQTDAPPSLPDAGGAFGSGMAAIGVKLSIQRDEANSSLLEQLKQQTTVAPDQRLQFNHLPIRIGWAEDSDVVLPAGPQLCNYHAIIRRRAQDADYPLEITNLNSASQTFVNGTLINGAHPLAVNDEIRVGAWVLIINQVLWGMVALPSSSLAVERRTPLSAQTILLVLLAVAMAVLLVAVLSHEPPRTVVYYPANPIIHPAAPLQKNSAVATGAPAKVARREHQRPVVPHQASVPAQTPRRQVARQTIHNRTQPAPLPAVNAPPAMGVIDLAKSATDANRFNRLYTGIYAGEDEAFYVVLHLAPYARQWKSVAIKGYVIDQTAGNVTPLYDFYEVKTITDDGQLELARTPLGPLAGHDLTVSFDIYGYLNARGETVNPAAYPLTTLNSESLGLLHVYPGKRKAE